MTDELFFDGARYVSAADAAGLSNFTRDYIARLAREGKILGKQVGRNWYVDQESLRSFILAQEYANSERREALTRERQQEYGRSQSAAPLNNASASEIRKPTAAQTLVSAGTASDLHRKLKESAMRAGSQVVSKANTLASSASAQTSLYAASPAFELVHKIAAAVLALVLVVGLYTADGSLLSSSPNFTGTGVTPNAELGAATGGFAAAFTGLAGTFVHGIDALVAPLYGAQPAGNSQQGVVAVQVTQKASNAPAPGSNTIAVSTGPVTQTTVVNPIVERVVQSEQVISSGGITESELDQKLQQLDNSLTARIVSETAANSTAIAQNYNVTAQTNAIDNLGNVTIENPTITGGSIANAGISGGTISGATISGATFTGTTTVEDFATTGSATSTFAAGIDLAGGCFAVNGTCISGGGGGAGNPGGSDTEVQFNDNGVFNGSSAFTFSTSTETLIVANASTTNATSTNFFAAAASFTSGVFSSLSATVASITGLNATNATTTNATTTNLYVSGELGLGSALPVSSGGTGTTSAPSYGQVLLGNSSGGYDLVSTSSLGIAGGGGNSFGYLFPNNATSTALTFSSGLLSLASTTIGNGNQNGGLTINGGATTTGNAYFAQSVGVGTTSPSQKLSVAGNAYITGNLLLGGNATTSSFFATTASSTNLYSQTASLDSLSLGSATTTAGNGFNITAGCFAVNGVCVGSGSGSSNVSTSSQNSWSALQIFSNASSTLTTLGTTWLSGVAADSLLSTNAAGEIAATTTIGSDLLSVPANSLLAGNSSGQLAATTSIGTNLLTGTLAVGNGGTGINSTPSYGNILVGNSSGGYDLVSTSSLGITGSGGNPFGYLFPSNATTTTLTFSSGLLSLASTTIGNGTQAGGLTIFGGATTTGASVLGGNVTFSSDNSYDIGASGANRPRNVYTAGYVLASNGLYSANDIGIDSSSNLSAPDGDGTFRITNNLGNNFDRLEFGGGTSAFPAIGRSGAGIVFELADQSGLAAIQAGNASTTLLSVASGSATTTISAATSTFAGGISLDSGCVQVNGSCIVSSAFTLDGSNNLFAESGALSNLTSGTNNIAAGTNALEYNTSGLYNIALGGSALLSNDNGEFNIAIGPSSLLNTDGGYNVALGEFSLRNLGSGYYNVALGSEAGANLSSGSNNILIGAGASGNGVYAPNSSGSNQLNIGNLIYGSGLDGDSATVSTGDIGIGTTSPYARFSIAGTSGGTAPLFAVASSTSLVFQIDKNGNTTIGNNGSTLTLPSVAASSLLALNSSNQVVATTSIGTDLLTGPLGTINGASFSIGGSITVSSTTLLANNNTFSGNDLFTASTTFSSLVNVANASTTVLSVSGNSYFNTAQASSFIISSLTDCSGGEALQTNSSGGLTCATVATGGASSGGGWTTNDIGSVALSTSTDRVGLGTSTPYAKLSVVSSNTATTTLALVPASGQTANILDIYNTSGALGSVFTSGGFLGLGTTSPGSILSINNSANFVNGATSTIYNGLNVTGGCVAVNGACLGSSSASTTLLANNNTFSGNNLFTASTTFSSVVNIANASTSLASFGTIWLPNLPNDLLSTNGSGQLVATTSIGISALSGVLPVANGGTGWANLTAGDVLFGNGSSALATSSQLFFNNSSGFLGVGTNSPYAQLTVSGGSSGNAFEIDSSASAASTTILQVSNAGLVSVGDDQGYSSGIFTIDASSSTTTISNLSVGNLVFDTDAGIVNLSDIPVDSNAANGVQQAQIINIGGNPVLTASGISNGSGGVGSLGVAIGGTTAPYATLEVWGPDASSTTNAFEVANNASTTLFTINDNGNIGIATTTPNTNVGFSVGTTTYFAQNVGIGTTSPSQALSIFGNGYFTGNLFLGGNATTTDFFSSVASSTNLFAQTAALGSLTLNGITNALLSTNGSGQLVATTSIGTNLLTGALGTINGTSFTAGGSITVASTTLLANNNTFSGNNLFSASTTFSNIVNITNASTSLLTATTAWIGTLNLTNALSVGNGGTGSTTLSGLLKGNGTGAVQTAVAGIDYESPITGSTGQIPYFSDTNTIVGTSSLNINANSFVGIGTTDPQWALNLVGAGGGLGSGTAYTNAAFLQDQTDYRGVELGYDSSGEIGVIAPGTNGTASQLAFWNYNGSGWEEMARFNGNGYFGIGTTSPSAALSVAGAAYVTATTTLGATTTIAGPLTLGNVAALSLLSTNANGQVAATTSIGTNLLSGTLATVNSTAITAGGTFTITAASSTLLANNNTFSGNNLFSASTTFSNIVNIANASTSLATFGSVWLPNISANSLLATNASGQVSASSSINIGLLNGILPIANGGTATSTGGVTNGVEFFNGTNLTNSAGFVYNGGNVGIGTTSPSQALSVQGNILSSGNLFLGGNATTTNFFATTASSTNLFGQTAALGSLALGNATTTAANGFNITAGCFSINGTCLGGASGSGTVSSGTQGQFAFYNTTGTTVSGTSTLFVTTAGNIGVGTTSAGLVSGANKYLTIASTGVGTQPSLELAGNSSTGGGGLGRIDFINQNNGDLDARISSVVGCDSFGCDTSYGDLVFSTDYLGTLTEAMRIDEHQDVGIGTTSPGSILAVQGVANFVANATSTLYNSLQVNGNLVLNGVNNSLLATNGSGQIVATTSISANLLAGSIGIGQGGTGTTTGGVTNGVEYFNGTNLTNSYGFTFNGTNVGIGTTTPWANLSVQATSGQTAPLFLVASTTGATTTTSLLVAASGDVGIGTTTPIDELQIAGLVTPTEASSTKSGLNEPQSVYVSGRYAYVASESNSSLVIFDISTPASPVEIGSTTSGLSSPDSVYVSGRYAYVSDFSNGLVIFDISNPASPIKVSSTSSGLSEPQSVYVSGRYAYIANRFNSTLAIFDISNPASPTEVGSTSSGLTTPFSVYVQGRYAYVADSHGALVAFDISNPASPTEVGSVSTGLNTPSFVYVQGRYAYVTSESNHSLVIFDISNPASPTEVGSTSSGMNVPDAVYVSGRYAYVVDGNNSLLVFDISNPASPTEVGSTKLGLSGPESVYVSGRYAYVASQSNSSLVTFNIGGEYTQSLEAGTLQAGSLALDNNLQALDGAFNGGLTVGNNVNVGGSFDLTASTFNATTTAGKSYSIFSINSASSTTPFLNVLYNGELGIATSTPNPNVGFAVGTTTYFANNVGIGTTSPSQLLSVGGNLLLNGSLVQTGGATSTFSNGINLTSGCFAVGGTCIGGGSSASSTLLANNNTFSGNNLFTASTTFSNLINVSNASTSLASFGSVWLPNLTNDLLSTNTSGQVVSTSSINVGLLNGILPIANGGTATSTGGVTNGVEYFNGTNLTNSSGFVFKSGDVGIGTTTPIDELQVAGLANPVEASSTTSGLGGPYSVYVSGRYAYVASFSNSSLVIFDISNPASPVKIGSTTTGLSKPDSVYVSGRYAYVADQTNGLVVFDVSNPASPTQVGSTISGLNAPTSVYVSGHYAYVASFGNSSLVIFDISNPASPVKVGSSSTGLSEPDTVYVSGHYAYVVDQGGALVVFDVSNPASPVEVGTVSTSLNSPWGVYVQGRYAYVVNETPASLVIFDISNPASPVKVGSSSTGLSDSDSVYVSGRYAYVADQNGLVIFDISNPASPVKVGSSSTGLSNPYSVYVSGRYAYVVSHGNTSLVTFDIGGEYTQSLEAGTLQAGSLELDNNLQAQDAAFSGGVNVGQSLNVTGGANITAASTTWNTTLPIFSVNPATSTNASGTALSPFLTILGNGNLGIGTSSPGSTFSVAGNGYITGNLLLGGNATSSDFFASVASSTNLFAQTASLGSLSLGSATTTAGNGFNISSGCFAVNGTCVGGSSGSSFGYLFPSNATTTTLTFSSGLLSLASTTIGNGTQAGGLTINGGATTTLNAYFGGNVGIGNASPGYSLDVGLPSGATSTGFASVGNLLISQLEGGTFLGRTKVTQSPFVTSDSSFGTTWTQEGTSQDYQGVAMSSDGKYQTATVFGGYIYVSTNYGVTWTQEGTSQDYEGVAMSSDGKYQTATVFGGYIYVSTNYGVTWTQEGTSQNYYGIAMSSDGKYQTADVYGGSIYVSTNYGVTWTQEGTSQDYEGVAMSSDGKYQTADVYGGYIYVSTNYGVTWTQEGTSQDYQGVAMSSDGKYQTAVVYSGYIYVSTNYGVTWTQEGTSQDYLGVAMSSDGKYQTAVDNPGYIYVSTNYGVTWTQEGTSQNYYGIAMSSDGKYQTAVNDIGYIYVSDAASYEAGGNVGVGTTTPWAKLSVDTSNLAVGVPEFSVGSSTRQDFVITQSGNVGIGTTSPGSIFSIGTTNGINFSTGTSTFSSTGGINLTSGCFAVGGTCIGGGSSLTGSTGQVAYFSGTNVAAGTSTLQISTAGNVGIGITPSWPVELSAGVNRDLNFRNDPTTFGLPSSVNGILIQGINDAQSAQEPITFEASNINLMATGGIGVGTTSPFANLAVQTATNGNAFGIANAAGTTDFNFSTINTASNIFEVASSSGSAYFDITSGGNVGIGTTSPASTFTVVGAGCFSKGATASVLCGSTAGDVYGTVFNAGAYDVAEDYVTSQASTTPGIIVGLDPANPEQVITATTSANVLGIVSTNPGVVLGGADASTANEHVVPIALSGRVPVEISLANGPINEGDRLALSSTTPGVAVKALVSGETIGIALESATSSAATSSIDVFVQPQYMTFSSPANSATSTEATSTPSALASGFFAGASTTLQQEISSLTDAFVKVFHSAVYAADGVFNKIYAQEVHTDELCVSDSSGETCITRTQLEQLLANAGTAASSSGGDSSSASGGGGVSSGDDATSSPPALQVNGANPATIDVGAVYSDLGATIIGPQADLNLGVEASVDGSTSSPQAAIQIDTSVVGTYTITYSATDQNGLVGTAERTVNVVAPQASSDNDGSATSTSDQSSDASSTSTTTDSSDSSDASGTSDTNSATSTQSAPTDASSTDSTGSSQADATSTGS